MNFINDKELEIRLEDLKNLIKDEVKPGETGNKAGISNATINAYRLKGIADGRIAWILYNLGVNAIQLNDNLDHEGNGARNFTYNENNYDLLSNVGLLDFVQAKSQNINPLIDGNTP